MIQRMGKKEKKVCIRRRSEKSSTPKGSRSTPHPAQDYACDECDSVGAHIILDRLEKKGKKRCLTSIEDQEDLEIGFAEKNDFSRLCPKCGMQIKSRWKTCLVCGAQL